MQKINAREVIASIRNALARVSITSGAVMLTRDEFEAVAAAVERTRPAPTPRTAPAHTQGSLDLSPAPTPLPVPPAPVFATGPLPGGLDADQIRALLVKKPRTAKALAREVRRSIGTVKRALAAMPDVAIVDHMKRAHRAGTRPNVYALSQAH